MAFPQNILKLSLLGKGASDLSKFCFHTYSELLFISCVKIIFDKIIIIKTSPNLHFKILFFPLIF